MLDAFGLTLNELNTRIQSFNQSISGGSITEMGMKYVVKGVSLLTDLSDFENTIVGYKSTTTGDQLAEKSSIFTCAKWQKSVLPIKSRKILYE